MPPADRYNEPPSLVSLDVQDMLCAQALAVVAQAMVRLRAGHILEIRYNADDVRHDLLAWARERGHRVAEPAPFLLYLSASASTPT